MINLEEVLPILLYLALIVLVIVFIVFIIKLIKTLQKVDVILDDVTRKLIKMDGLFSLIDRTTDQAANISEKVTSALSKVVNFILRRKKGKSDEDEYE